VIDMVDRERIDAGASAETDPIPVQGAPEAQAAPPGAAVQAAPGEQPPVEKAYHKAKRTSGLWVRITIAVIVLVLLLVFIIENGQTVDIGYFGAHLRLPLGVALLLAAIGGVLLVLVLSAGRIVQLRRTLRKAAHRASS
jgi:uncharacterized integral membrane protein